MSVLDEVYGPLLIVRPPAPATLNKAGANYKSEVAHTTYAPRRAYDEWLAILDGIVACGGDALYAFEDVDEPLLDHAALEVDGDGAIRPAGAREVVGHVADVMTGRVFAANGPWVTRDGGALRAVMPAMLPHRRPEAPYYRALIGELADAAGLTLAVIDNPHRWEGMADVAVVGKQVILTFAVPGRYDHATAPRSARSSRAGVAFAADAAGVPAAARIYAELVYPHFHGDTAHFGARPPGGPPVLVAYPGGLYGDAGAAVARALGPGRVVPIGRADAVDAYAGNSRQVGDGVLVPDGVSDGFVATLARLGLAARRVPLAELFGKAGGGPACATLQLPRGLALPRELRHRYSVNRAHALARRARIPERLRVDPALFASSVRG